MRELIEALAEANAAGDRVFARILAAAKEIEATGQGEDVAAVLWEVAEVIGRCEQARHGQLVQLLAQADRVSARKGVLKPWIVTHLDVSDSKARGIAEAVKRIGTIPELAEPLVNGHEVLLVGGQVFSLLVAIRNPCRWPHGSLLVDIRNPQGVPALWCR